MKRLAHIAALLVVTASGIANGPAPASAGTVTSGDSCSSCHGSN